MKSLSLATIAALLLGACVLTDNDDDDGGADTGTNPSTSNPSTTDSSTTNPSTTDSSTTDPSTGTTDVSTSESGATEPVDTGSSETGEGVCGWGITGEKTIPEGYVCGGEGEDPSGLMPSTCAEGVALVEGGECGGEMGITGVGCCDANGDVWFCADDGSGPILYTADC